MTFSRMRNLSLQEFNKLTQSSIVLAEDEFGKKVLELVDHSIIKLFRVKRFISQATLYSPKQHQPAGHCCQQWLRAGIHQIP